MFRIGMFSRMTNLTVKALRYYDEEGLFKPAHVDPATGYRYYGSGQLAEIHRIIALRQIGFSIEDIASLLRGRKTDAIVHMKRRELDCQLNETLDRISRLNYYIASASFDGARKETMTYTAAIKTTPECIVYSKRFKAPDHASYFKLIPAIGEEVTAANPGLKCSEPPYCFIECHDKEYKENDIDIELCEAVETFGKETDDIKFKKLPAITVVATYHKGPYRNFPDAYKFLYGWIERNGYAITGNPRENYIDGIWNKESETDWLTELQIPVEKKAD